MFQKIRNIIIVFILLVSTTGVSLSKHYSGGELYSVSLIGDAESCCTDPCDCCNDESDFYKLDVDYLISSVDNPEIKVLDLFKVITLSTDTLKSDSDTGRSFEIFTNLSPPETIHTQSFLQSFLC